LKRHQRQWLYGEIKGLKNLEIQKNSLEERINRYQGDLARLSSPGMDVSEEKVQGNSGNPIEVSYMSICEKISRLQLQHQTVSSKVQYVRESLNSLPEAERLVIEMEIQEDKPRWKTIETLEGRYNERYSHKRVQTMRASALEQLLKELLGVMA